MTLSCPDKAGLMSAVTGFIAIHGGNILESANFSDPFSGRFFMRNVFAPVDGAELDLDALRRGFAPLAAQHGMAWHIVDAHRKMRVMLAVSKFGHCLNHLLHLTHSGMLPIEITAVVSNHDAMRRIVEWHDIPYHHLPVTPETKAEQEAIWQGLIADTDTELLVLARYMQILSDSMTAALAGRVINIHHSFLPGFKGAKPYHQAHERGVKMIGATAHFVTADLDEGPIIAQGVEPVTHADSPDTLINIGRDVESVVLGKAMQWVAERRVLLNDRRTVVFT